MKEKFCIGIEVIDDELEFESLLISIIRKFYEKYWSEFLTHKKISVIIGTSLGNIEGQMCEFRENGYVKKHFFDCEDKIKKIFKEISDVYFVSNTCVSGIDAMGIALTLLEQKSSLCLVITADTAGNFIKKGLSFLNILGEKGMMTPFGKEDSGLILKTRGAGLLLTNKKKVAFPYYGRILYAESGISEINSSNIDIGLVKTINHAMKMSGLDKKKIDLIVSAANGNRSVDIIQNNTIQAIFEKNIYIATFKSKDQHTLGNSGIVDVINIFTCWSKELEIEPICYEIDYERYQSNILKRYDVIKKEVEYAMIISIGMPSVQGVACICR